MFRIRRCFNISTSERPDGDFLVVALEASFVTADVDGLEIVTTSPNCAEDAEELFFFIGITSPNCAPAVVEAVTFEMALFNFNDSSFSIPSLSLSS